MPPVRLLLVSGSTSSGSTNTVILRTAEALSPEKVITTLLYGGLANLPAFNPDDDHEPLHTVVGHLRRQLDAVLFCTTEYTGARPGPAVPRPSKSAAQQQLRVGQARSLNYLTSQQTAGCAI